MISVNVKPAKLPIQMLRTLILEFQSMVTSAARDALTPRIANSESTLHRILDTSIVPVFLVAFHGTRQCSGLANLVTTFFFFPYVSLYIFLYIKGQLIGSKSERKRIQPEQCVVGRAPFAVTFAKGAYNLVL